tara:strand:+ start:2083 stop:3078 length:996 start_codon:yes stop_codon:yes gene_type:complete
MTNKNFVIPDGMEYFMPNDAKKFEALKQKALQILAKLKYEYINPPIFDNLDNLLSLKSADLDIETLTVTDHQAGGEIGIRADITPQVSKIDYQLTNGKGTKRYSYMGDILRSSSRDFDRKNPFQLGVEIFGKNNKASDLEIIKSMIEIISLSKQKKIIIELGDVSLINSFLENFNIDKNQKRILINLINLKSSSEIKCFCKNNSFDKKSINFLLELIKLSGDIKVINEIKKLASSNKINFTRELNDLWQIAAKIKQYKKSISVQIDLCELVGYEYQTSIIYTAYVSSFRKEIAKGGRYNAYKTNKTQYREATGFSLDLKDIFDLSLTRELI